jgi:hypothetical protein
MDRSTILKIAHLLNLYYDLMEPYIELLKDLFSRLINYLKSTVAHDSSVNLPQELKRELTSVLKESTYARGQAKKLNLV